MSDAIRYDWTVDEVLALMTGPLEPLLERARCVHAEYGAQDVQKCRLLSVKTGGCSEDCGYCSQSAHYKTEVKAETMLPTDDVLRAAREARDAGATRFCMGTAWRQVPEGQKFREVLKMIRGVRDRYINLEKPPASTLLGVAALAFPGLLVEVEAVAVLP